MQAPVRLLLVIMLSTASLAAGQPAARTDIDRAIAAINPSLVRISVVTVDYANGREIRAEISGSGTIISTDGHVVTNHHVAGRARRIVCTLFDKEEMPADLVGTDPLSDIAVIKLRPPLKRTFPAAAFARSASVVRGDPVLAFGSPLALSQSVTLGIVSNVEMIMPSMRRGLSLEGEDVGSIVRWIGHDAAIYPGNSGGPLVNLRGEIIGVNEISFGLAGAIPGELAQAIARDLIADGRVHRAWTGLELQPTMSSDRREGALISWVADGSPAAAAGIEAGDLLVRIGDRPVNVKFAEEVPLVNQMLAGMAVGKPMRVELLHGPETRVVSLQPVERAAALGSEVELREWGIVAANLTSWEARGLARASLDGVRVVSLRSGGAAEQAKPSLQPDDVIVEIEGKPLRSVADLARQTESLLGARPRASVLVALERGEEHRLAVVELVRLRTTPPPQVEARKASLPVSVQVLTPQLADRLGVPGRSGVRITRVTGSSVPLRAGDIVLAIDGALIRASAPADEEVFAALLRQYAIGSDVTLTVYRSGAEVPVRATLEAAPRQAREMRRYDALEFGFRARELAVSDRDNPRLHDLPAGVVVDAVESGGWAALARLATGDVIVSADGVAIDNVDDLAAHLKTASAARQPSVVFKLRRGVRTLFVELEPVWPD